MLMEAKGSR